MVHPLLATNPYRIEKSELSKTFWNGLEDGKFFTTQCDNCNEIHYPPAPVLCSKCLKTDINWIELPLSGTITTHTRVNLPPMGFKEQYTLIVVLIDLLNKPVLGRYTGDNPEIGKKVKIEFEKINGLSLFVFSDYP